MPLHCTRGGPMLRPRLVPRRRRLRLTALIVIAALGAGIGPVTAAGGGTKTSQPAMLTAVGAGITVTPLITVGETAGDEGYVFESVPDGIAVKVRNNGVADIYVNHETSRVPFPYTPSAPTEVELTERLRQRSGQPTDAPPKERRRAERQAGHHQRQKTTSASARATSPPRPRASTASCCSRTRRASTGSTGPATPGRPSSVPTRRASPASSSRYDVKSGNESPDLGHGPPQPRELRADPGLR